MPIYNLKQKKIIVTRPQPQAQKLSDLIRANNGIPFCIPLIEIKPVEIKTKQIPSPDWLIFISQNAVKYGIKLCLQYPQAKIISIGNKTTQGLKAQGIKTNIQAPPPYTSETLLSLPSLQYIENNKILIIKGGKGRNVLFNTLLERKAEVQTIDVYQRLLLSPPLDFIPFEHIPFFASIITSEQILIQLNKLLMQSHLFKIKQQPLIVISLRLKEKAKKLGFKTIFIAKSANNEHLIQILASI